MSGEQMVSTAERARAFADTLFMPNKPETIDVLFNKIDWIIAKTIIILWAFFNSISIGIVIMWISVVALSCVVYCLIHLIWINQRESLELWRQLWRKK